MKKLAVKKNAECMACLQCAQACSEAFYKEFDITKACIKIVAGKNGGAKPNTCIQCGKCMRTCEHEAITQNPKTGVYMINKKKCVGCGKCVERNMDVKGWAITAGIGAAAGAVAILMMPRNNPTRRLAAKAANKMEDVAWKVEDTISEKMNDLDL